MSVDTVVAFVSWCFYIYTLFLLLHILLSWFQLPYNPLLNKVPPEQIFSSPREERTREFLARVLEAGRL